MRRLWHRLYATPSQRRCTHCTAMSNSAFLIPALLVRSVTTPPIFPLGLFKAYHSASSLQNQIDPTIQSPQIETNSRKNKAIIFADFYRSLATQDIDRIWPLYTYLYDHNLLNLLTRRNYQTLVTYTVRARACQKNLHRLSALVDDMRGFGHHLRLTDYNSLINWVGGKNVPHKRPSHLVDALRIFEDMQKVEIVDDQGRVLKNDPVTPSVVTFNLLIHIAAQLPDIRTAQKLYHDMISRGLQPDAYTYSTLLHAMGKLGDVSSIDHLLQEIRNNKLGHLVNNTVIWNVVMSGYACNGLSDRAYAMFDQMVKVKEQQKTKSAPKKKQSSKVGDDQATTPKQVPIANAESFRICIDLMIHDERREDAILALKMMRKLKIKPIVTVYNTLFASFTKSAQHHLFNETDDENEPEKENKLVQLKQLYQSMSDAQVKPNSETMYTLVSAFLDLGDTKSALEKFVFLSNNNQTEPSKKSIQFNTVAALAKERLLISKYDPLQVLPSQDLLDRLNNVVTKTVI